MQVLGNRKPWPAILILGAVFLAGCNNQDSDRLGNVAKKAALRLEKAVGGSQGRVVTGLQAVRGSLSETTLDSRVAVRLAWEKTLEEADIHVQIVSPGVVKLQGHVREFPVRLKAQDVALATQGVNQVVNELEVAQ
jgi:osmotically-inducible protein OsmY